MKILGTKHTIEISQKEAGFLAKCLGYAAEKLGYEDMTEQDSQETDFMFAELHNRFIEMSQD